MTDSRTPSGAPGSPFLHTWPLWSAGSESTTDLIVLAELVESGDVTPVVDRIHPLEEAAAAIRHMLDGKARGTLAVSVSPGRMQTPHPGSTP
jgi:NADPH:quinone reductase-like Zn-dependent oxidoreductase